MLGSFRFAPFRDRVLLTNDAGRFVFLTQEEFNALIHREIQGDTLAMLKERLFYTDEPEEVYVRHAIPAVRDNHNYLFNGTSLFIFAITNRCNQRCVYCQAHGNAALADMDLRTVRAALDRIAASPSPEICIEFQGGEPLYNLPAIRETVRLAGETLHSKRVSFALVSNLMLMTEEIADFLAQNNIAVSTSLDGPRVLHERNRPCADVATGPFDRMLRGLEMLRKRGLHVGAIQTTTRASLPFAREIVRTYAELDFDAIFLRPLTRLGVAKARWQEIGYEPDEFVRFYQEGIEEALALSRQGIRLCENHASIFLQKLLKGVSPNYMELRSPCGAGIGQMAITASGDVYTCDEGRMLAQTGDQAFRLGNVFENGYADWVSHKTCKAICAASLLEALPGCCDCVYQPYCGVCPVVQYALDGNLTPSRPNEARCRIYRGMLDTLMDKLYEGDPQTISVLQDWAEI